MPQKMHDNWTLQIEKPITTEYYVITTKLVAVSYLCYVLSIILNNSLVAIAREMKLYTHSQ